MIPNETPMGLLNTKHRVVQTLPNFPYCGGVTCPVKSHQRENKKRKCKAGRAGGHSLPAAFRLLLLRKAAQQSIPGDTNRNPSSPLTLTTFPSHEPPKPEDFHLIFFFSCLLSPPRRFSPRLLHHPSRTRTLSVAVRRTVQTARGGF